MNNSEQQPQSCQSYVICSLLLTKNIKTMSKEIRQMIDRVKNFKQFVNENVENDRDITKIKSQLFFIDNTYKNNEGELKYVELKPFKSNIVDKIFVYSNSVVFYRNNEPVDEIKNISMNSNIELVSLIEDRLNNLA